jgi:enoyl-CoA hydratase/carnithine racemase
MAIYRCPVPVIAAVDGYSLGGGMELILAADITVAAKTAKIGVPTINLGGIPCWTATQLLPRIVGHSCASDILLTGRILSAEECYHLRLVEYLTEKEDLMTKAFEIANTIADKSPHAVSLMRKAIKDFYEQTNKMIGFKAAGGIVNKEDALCYFSIVNEILGEKWIKNGLFRIGASRLIDNLWNEIKC